MRKLGIAIVFFATCLLALSNLQANQSTGLAGDDKLAPSLQHSRSVIHSSGQAKPSYADRSTQEDAIPTSKERSVASSRLTNVGDSKVKKAVLSAESASQTVTSATPKLIAKDIPSPKAIAQELSKPKANVNNDKKSKTKPSKRLPPELREVVIANADAPAGDTIQKSPYKSVAVSSGPQCVALKPINELTEQDIDIARHAWKYVVNNTQESTGLVNAANKYPSTTMWDTGSAMASIVTAESLGIIDKQEMLSRLTKMMETLADLDLFFGEAPNKVYNTKTGAKVDYSNQESENGIGVSALDLGRMVSWLNIISCMHPELKPLAEKILYDWSYCRVIQKEQMFGMALKKTNNNSNKAVARMLQEGRLGYEQYAGKAFELVGFSQGISAKYLNKHTIESPVEGINIKVDRRDSKTLGAYNYVVSESYAMDYTEHGPDAENMPIIEDIYDVQQKRWERTGIVTAVSEDNLDRSPYFVYNTIYVDGEPWKAITDTGADMGHLRSISTKAALSMAYVFPDRPYSKVLFDSVVDARNPDGGFYSGIFEDPELGINKATTANTNGVIMSLILAKKYGPLNQVCTECGRGIRMDPKKIAYWSNQQQCETDVPKLVASGKNRSKRLAKARWETEMNKLFALVDTVSNADQQRAGGDLAGAAAEIKKLKGPIWSLSMKYKAEEKTLQGLMGPIDSIVAAWKAGNKEKTAAGIQKTLNSAVERIRDSKT